MDYSDTSRPDRFPGWYGDKEDPATQRFWDGLAWTSSTRSIESSALTDVPEHLIGPIDSTLEELIHSFESEHPPLAQRLGHPSTFKDQPKQARDSELP